MTTKIKLTWKNKWRNTLFKVIGMFVMFSAVDVLIRLGVEQGWSLWIRGTVFLVLWMSGWHMITIVHIDEVVEAYVQGAKQQYALEPAKGQWDK